MSKENKYLKAVISKLENFCDYQERCIQEVQKKLQNFELSAADKKAVFEHLQANKYLDQARFIGSFVRDKFRFRRWGRIRLRQELWKRGVAPDDIDSALDEEITEEAYAEQLAELIAIKNRVLREEDPYKRKQKLARFALGRGFEMGLIWESLRKFGLPTDDAEPEF